MLREACAQQVRWLQEFPDHELQMRVNLSAVQLGQPDLLSQVVEILHETGIAAGQLCLEITETVVMADAESSLALLEKLRGLGVELAIDDFGTGVLVAQLPQAAPGERVEDRPVLRRRAGHRSRRHRHRRADHGAGLVAGAAGDRRGGRERGAARRAAAPGLPAGAGLPLLPAQAADGDLGSGWWPRPTGRPPAEG